MKKTVNLCKTLSYFLLIAPVFFPLFIQTSEQKDQPRFYPNQGEYYGCKNIERGVKAIIEQGRFTDLRDGDLLYSKKIGGMRVYVAARLAEGASPIMHVILGTKKGQGFGPKQAVMMVTTCQDAGPDEQEYLPLMQKTKNELEKKRGYVKITQECARCETDTLFNKATFYGRSTSGDFFWKKMRELFNSDYCRVLHCWKKSNCTQHQQ